MPEKKDDILKTLDELKSEVRELRAFVKALYAIVVDSGMGFEEDLPDDEFPGLHLMFNDEDFSM